jgi:hypothetical protein
LYLYFKDKGMYSEARKLHLIEEVLSVKSDEVLIAIEKIINTYKRSNAEKRITIQDFAGIISEQEAKDMKKAIAETCENIDENDWK